MKGNGFAPTGVAIQSLICVAGRAGRCFITYGLAGMKSIRREIKSPAIKRGHELSVLEEPMSALA
jgi:hypothetical protein